MKFWEKAYVLLNAVSVGLLLGVAAVSVYSAQGLSVPTRKVWQIPEAV